jgi:hypothetical protein
MKLLIAALTILLISCSQKRSQPDQKPADVPEALTESKSEVSLLTKRGYKNNLVEELYSELLEKDTSLKSLEEKIDHLKSKRPDSLAIFNNYVSKNEDYYSDAKNFIAGIKDSVLKKYIEEVFGKSKTNLANRLVVHKSLIHEIEKKDSALKDVHLGLMFVSTLKMMENYQKSNMPSQKPIQNINEQFEKVLAEAKKKLNSY